jgi:hypothetical protein
MPSQPIDYANTVIYKIVCNDLSIEDVYVGHTTDFTIRKWSHKSTCKNINGKNSQSKLYKNIRDNGGWDNYSMIEVEKFPCADANEARAKERVWFELLNSKLNTQYPNRNSMEYNRNYDKTHKDEKRQWYENNKIEITIKRRQHYLDNKEQILANCHNYANNHKEEIHLREKLRRVSHKEENSIRRSKRIICECGIEINLDHKSRHLKTKVHNDNLNTLK